MPAKIARMSDAELVAEIERLTREMNALCGRGMFPEPSDPAAPQWKALERQRRKLEQERNYRAEAVLRTMSDGEVAAARSSEDYQLRLLAEREHKRREQETTAQTMPRFERMTCEELMQFAADPRGATAAELRAAKEAMWQRREQLAEAEAKLSKFELRQLQEERGNLQAKKPEQITPPQRALGRGGWRVNNPSKPITIFPPRFPGEEDMEYWAVVYADGVGPEDGIRELWAVNNDPSLGDIWIARENLILADAELCAAETAMAHPDRRIFVVQMPSWRRQ